MGKEEYTALVCIYDYIAKGIMLVVGLFATHQKNKDKQTLNTVWSDLCHEASDKQIKT
jgi:hypothetical protein